MLPIIVLCRVYTTYLNTTPDAHMHRLQRPLALQELYDPEAPAAGLLALLKFALWQVLWVESPSSECTCLSHLQAYHTGHCSCETAQQDICCVQCLC